MIVAFLDSGIDARDINFGDDRGIFRMLAVDVDLAVKSRELPVGCSEILMNAEADGGTCLIELVSLTRGRSRAETGEKQNEWAESNECFHLFVSNRRLVGRESL